MFFNKLSSRALAIILSGSLLTILASLLVAAFMAHIILGIIMTCALSGFLAGAVLHKRGEL